MTDSTMNTPVGAELAAASDDASEVRLPRPPGVFRRWLAAHPRAVDWTIVAFYLFGCVLMLIFQALFGFMGDALTQLGTGPDEQLRIDVQADEAAEVAETVQRFMGPWLIVLLVSIAIVAVALRFRRRYPLAGLLTVAVLTFFELGLLGVPNSVALVFLLYAIPVYKSVAHGWVGYGVVVVLGTVGFFLTDDLSTGLIGPTGLNLVESFDFRESLAIVIMNALWLLAILMIAINFGNRRRYVDALIERAHQLAREREQQAQFAAVQERSRIAREMHDIVAHSLSVVVTLSEAASVAVESQPGAAKQAMEQASETGRTALMEMRRLLGVLNDEGYGDVSVLAQSQEGAPRLPQPGIAQLPGLIEGFRQAGLRVTVSEEGVPAGDATQQLVVFRIAQEGLTNALRYAGRGAEVHLELAHSTAETRMTITDGGSSGVVSSRSTLPGSGRGLRGAAERARLFGGWIEAGPVGNGWRLLASVPTRAPAGSSKTTGMIETSEASFSESGRGS